VIGCLENLKEVLLRGCFVNNTDVRRGITSMLNKTTTLEVLDLSLNHYCRRSKLQFLGLPYTLTSLDISGCCRIDGNVLQEVQHSCPNLTSLSMDINTLNMVTDMDKFFLNLQSLKIFRLSAWHMDEIDLRQIMAIQHLKNLEELVLTEGMNVGDEMLVAIISRCPKLTKIYLDTSYYDLTVYGLMHLQHLKNLKELEMYWIDCLSDDVVQAIANNGRLEVLNLAACENITDEAIIYAYDKCPNLQEIDVRNCRRVTDRAIRHIVDSVKSRPKRSGKEELYIQVRESGITWPIKKKFKCPEVVCVWEYVA